MPSKPQKRLCTEKDIFAANLSENAGRIARDIYRLLCGKEERLMKKMFNPWYILSGVIVAFGTLIGQYAAITEWKKETDELKEFSESETK